MNPEAFFWLMIVMSGSVYVASIIAGWIADRRERRRIKEIMNASRAAIAALKGK